MKLNEEIESMKKNLKKLEEEKTNMQDSLNNATNEINALKLTIEKSKKTVISLETSEKNLQLEIENLNNEIKKFTYDKKDYKDFLSYCELNKNLIEEIYPQINNGSLYYATQLAAKEKRNKALMNMCGLFRRIRADMSSNDLKFTPEEVTKFSNQIMIEKIYICIHEYIP
jgi:chromosome segregation ATPase